jgi:hypothetical protein
MNELNDIQKWRKGIWSTLDWKRFILHIPIGMINFIGFTLNSGIGFAFFIGFIIYELNEDLIHLKDMAFKDIIGWLFGFGISIITLYILSLYGIMRI